MLLQQKRETFHVQLRRNQREQIFQKKRQVTQQMESSEEIQGIIFALKTQSVKDLNELFDSLFKALPKYSELHHLTFPYLQQTTQTYINDQESSMMQINDDDRELSLKGVQALLQYLGSLTFYIKVDFDLQNLLDLLIATLNVAEDFNTIKLLCSIISNLLIDFPQGQDYLLQCDIVTKLACKFMDCSLIYDLMSLQPFFIVLQQLHQVGYFEFNQVHPLLYRLQNDGQMNKEQSGEVIEVFFQFLCNCTNEYDRKRKNSVLLFDKLLEFQYVKWAVSLFFKYNKNIKLLNTLYQFLLNLSMGDVGTRMIEQGVLSVIQVHLNEGGIPQSLLYSILSNLIVDDFDSIFQCGILTRVHHHFEQGFPDGYYIVELLYCLVAAFQKASEKQLKELIKLYLTDCFTLYITDTPVVDVELCDQICEVLEYIFRVQPKKSKYNLLRKLKANPTFLMRSSQLFEQPHQGYDKLELMLNYLYK